MCDCTPVPRRMLEFKTHEDPKILGHFIRTTLTQPGTGTGFVVITHQDGLGCPRCDSFTPTGPRVERTH